MSLITGITGAHLVTKFDSKKSQPLGGQRLAKVGYKSSASKLAKYPSVCVSVPYIQPTEVMSNINALLPAIGRLLETAQDGIVRSMYEASDGMLTAVSDADISVLACIGYLEAESTGGRLTKEWVEAWFVDSLGDYVTALLADKLGYTASLDAGNELTPEQEATIGKHVNGYKGLFSSLAGGKTILQEGQVKSMMKVLELADTDDTSSKLQARLIGMLNKPKMEELLEL